MFVSQRIERNLHMNEREIETASGIQMHRKLQKLCIQTLGRHYVISLIYLVLF